MKFFYSFTLLLFLFNFCFAQADTTKKAKSDRITVFDKTSGLEPFQGYTDTSKSHKKWNAFKFNPFLLIGGDLPIYYERQVTKHSSLEFGIGLAFENIFLANANDLAPLVPDIPDGSIWKPGVTLKAAYKFYPGIDEMMDGFYVSPEIAYRRNGLQTAYYDVNNEPTETYYNGVYSYTDLKVLVGYETTILFSETAIGEVYTGIGLRSYNLTYNESDSDNNGVYANKIVSETDIKPHFYFGFKIGFRIR